MKILLKLCLIITSMYISHSQSEAGNIKVVNENKKNIIIKIIPEGSVLERAIYKQNLSAERYSEFSVSAADINGKSYFMIEGDTHSFVGDKCKHLSIEKNYKVTFQDDAVGTTCVAEEVK